MKRLLAFLMMASMVFTLTACGSKTAADQNAGDDQTASEPEKTDEDEKENEQADDSAAEAEETEQSDQAPADGYDLVILDSDKVVYEEADGVLILNRIEMKSDGTDIARITYTVKNTSNRVLSTNYQGKEPLLSPGEGHTETYEISTEDMDGIGYLFGGSLYDPEVIDHKDNNQLMLVFQYMGFFNVINGELLIEQLG